MTKTKFLTQAAIIASLYVILTILFQPISFLQAQLRISEVLTVLPFFTPAAIPGLFVGCLVSNFLSPVGVLDIILGSLATLVASLLSYKMPNRYLVSLPPVIVNAIAIGILLNYVLTLPLIPSILWVALGQTIICYGLGYPLILLLNKHRDKVFN